MRKVLLIASVLAAGVVTTGAQSADAVQIRASFLQLIDRPRVPLAPTTKPRLDSGFYAAEHFTFASAENERVPGIFLKSTASKGRRPVIIFLHGTGAKKEDQLALMRTIADRGFATAGIDAPHHGERVRGDGHMQQYFDAMVATYRTGKGRPYLYDTVWDVMRLIDYLETRSDVDSARIGIMGISKGGTEAYIAAAVDPRIAVVVPVIGVQSFRWALDHDQWQPRVAMFGNALENAARDDGVSKVDAQFVRRFYDRVAPGIYGDLDGPSVLRLIAPRPMLIINGDSDRRTPLAGVEESVNAARKVYASLGAEDKLGLYLQPNAGHVFTPTAELVMADWFVRWMKP